METARRAPPPAAARQTPADDLPLLVEAVREAGALALSYFGKRPKAERKPDGTEVSEADYAVDALLKERLAGPRPDYGWLSEETADDRTRLDRGRVWIVDPIDGTRAFLKERPEWTISAALVEAGAPILAAVYNPARGEFFQAVRGGGARLDDRPMQVSETGCLEGCLLIASRGLLARDIWDDPWPQLETRWVNSIAYRLALVAAGQGDGTLSLSRKSEWDLAAADLLVQEAGGAITTRSGEALSYNRAVPEQDSVIAAGPGLYPELLRRTRSVRL